MLRFVNVTRGEVKAGVCVEISHIVYLTVWFEIPNTVMLKGEPRVSK